MTEETLTARLGRYRPLVVDEMRAVVASDRAELFGWMRYHLGWEDRAGQSVTSSPGKLLRPAALLLAIDLVGGAVEAAVPAAAAVELVHNFSLLHDDVEDNSEERRGRPTVWTFAGTAQAINAGDGMFVLARLAMHRLLEAGIEERRVIEAMRELDEACLRLVEGQYLDLAFETRPLVTREEYLAMTAGKTAALFAAPFAIGALLGGASGEVVAAFRAYGHHIGLAFQAVDDILGIWGEPAVTGKPAGDDLHARKMTYPVIAALEAGDANATSLAHAYGTPPATTEDVRRLATLVEAAGGRAATEAFAASEVTTALSALEPAGLSADARDLLAEFTSLATSRVQ